MLVPILLYFKFSFYNLIFIRFCRIKITVVFSTIKIENLIRNFVNLFLLSFKEDTVLKTDLLPCIFAIIISIFLTTHFLPKAETTDLKADIYYKIREYLLQGTLSFVGFIFLGFLFGNEALTLNLNTIAIGIGSALSGGIIQLPKLLLEKIHKQLKLSYIFL